MNKKTVSIAILLTSSLFNAGCASLLDKPGSLANAWADRFREFQIYPVFPPREDIQVGDMYVTCDSLAEVPGSSSAKAREGHVPVARLVASTPGVNDKLHARYKGSVLLPEASTARQAAQETDADGTLGKFPRHEMYGGKSATDRLRNVSLPELFSITASGVDVSALLPSSAFLAGVGIGAQDVRSVTISIPSAGSYGLPAVDLEPLLANVPIESPNRVLEAFTNSECQGAPAQFVVISEVYAAYAINMHMNFTSQAAARIQAAANLPTGTGRKAAYDALSTYFGPGGDNKDATARKDASAPVLPHNKDELVGALKDLAAALDKESNPGFPGVKMGFYSGSASGITLERKFVNPVVIGYRGFSVNYPPDEKTSETSEGATGNSRSRNLVDMSRLMFAQAGSSSGGSGQGDAAAKAPAAAKPWLGPVGSPKGPRPLMIADDKGSSGVATMGYKATGKSAAEAKKESVKQQ